MTIFMQVLIKADGTYDRSTTVYDTMNEAEIAYHNALASAMGKPDYKKVIAMLINNNGEVVMRRVWAR